MVAGLLGVVAIMAIVIVILVMLNKRKRTKAANEPGDYTCVYNRALYSHFSY